MILDPLVCRSVLDNLFEGVFFLSEEREIVYWNQAAESITGYRREDVLGRTCSESFLSHMSENGSSYCQGQCPFCQTPVVSLGTESLVFLCHQQGHRVGVWLRSVPVLDQNGKRAGAFEVFRAQNDAQSMAEKIKRLEEMALLDGLTRLANRSHTEANLQIRLEELDRYGWPFGVLFVDIDHFKAINDQFGHEQGDKVLKLVAMTLQNSLRPFDFLGRWGGEEFLAIVINVTQAKLEKIAERARMLIQESKLVVGKGQVELTVSIGATLAHKKDQISDLVKMADQLMYQSKKAGRNRVTINAE